MAADANGFRAKGTHLTATYQFRIGFFHFSFISLRYLFRWTPSGYDILQGKTGTAAIYDASTERNGTAQSLVSNFQRKKKPCAPFPCLYIECDSPHSTISIYDGLAKCTCFACIRVAFLPKCPCKELAYMLYALSI